MLTFEQWKKDNNIVEESIDVNLGISNPSTFASFGSFSDLLEARKKMKKKMDLGDMGKDDDTGDEDMGDDDDDHEDDDDMGDDDDFDGDDNEDGGDDDGDMEDKKDGDMGDDDNPGVPDSPMMRMKKKMAKMKKKMKAENSETEEVAEEPIAEAKCDCGKCEKCKKCDCGKCPQCVKKESFAQSLSKMLHDSEPNKKNSAFGQEMTEDSILPLIDPNTGLIIQQKSGEEAAPKAGEVGFAPSTRLGLF